MPKNFNKTPTVLRLAFGDPESLAATSPIAARLKTFCTNALAAWEKIREVHERKTADETMTPAARLAESADFARVGLDTLGKEFDAAIDQSEARLTALDAEIRLACKPQHYADAVVDAGLREWANKNSDKVLSRLESTPDLARAIASAPALLSGVTDSVHAKARALYAAKVAPKLSQEFDEIRVAVAAAGEAIKHLDGWTHELIDFDQVDALRKITGKA